MTQTTAIILAAGKGSRMKSSKPKPMHTIAGIPLLEHSLQQLNKNTKIIVVHSPNQTEITTLAQQYHAETITQKQQLGTAHAVQICTDKIQQHKSEKVIVLFADSPLVSTELIEKLTDSITEKNIISIAAFKTNNPNAYGRIILDSNNQPSKIIEVKDATAEQKKITLCNGGIMALHASALPLLDKIDNENKQKEYLLPHIVEIARKQDHGVSLTLGEEQDFMGVNTAEDLAYCESIWQERMRKRMLSMGVRMQDPSSVYFSVDTEIESDVFIEPCVYFGLGVRIGRGACIRGFSHISGATIGEGAIIGPFARLRPDTLIGDNSKVGNFVEVKNSRLGSGVRASHLSYLGDSDLGSGVNIGAGVITCNYDGVKKSTTEIGDETFIGANASLVAPVKIGKGSRVGAGSVITDDIGDDELVVVRKRQSGEDKG